MRIFFDTSSLAKRYITENGTNRVNHLSSLAVDIILSSITAVEFISALSRRMKEGCIKKTDYLKIKKYFAEDLKGVTSVEFYPAVIKLSIKCIEENNIRTLDAVQVASAVVAQADLFVTSDRKQAKAAAAAGLEVEIV